METIDNALSTVFKNRYSSTLITLFLVLYSGLVAPKLPKLIVKFFPNIKLKKQSRKKIIYNYKPKQGFYKSQKYILNKLRIFIKQYEK